MARQWILDSQDGFEKSLQYQTNVEVPSPESLGANQVLVKLYGASLNYRELVIAGPMVCVFIQVLVFPLLTWFIRESTVPLHPLLCLVAMEQALSRQLGLRSANSNLETESSPFSHPTLPRGMETMQLQMLRKP